MIKRFLYSCIIFSICLPGIYAHAQDVKIHPSIDSVVVQMEDEPEGLKNKKQRFSLVQSQDKMPVNNRQINEADLNKLRQDKAFWYADYKQKPLHEEKRGKSFVTTILSSQWFKILLFIIFGIAIAWLLISGDFKLFRPKAKALKQNVADEADQNIFETDFENEISKAVSSNNYPLAIRLHYLHVLKELSLKNIIQYSPDYTNQQFVQQLKNSNYYNDFFSLTRSFEYIWYGQFPLSEPAFKKFQNNFILFKNNLPD